MKWITQKHQRYPTGEQIDEHRLLAARGQPLGRVGRDSYDKALAESTIGQVKAELIHRRGPWRVLEPLEFARVEYLDWSRTTSGRVETSAAGGGERVSATNRELRYARRDPAASRPAPHVQARGNEAAARLAALAAAGWESRAWSSPRSIRGQCLRGRHGSSGCP